jgi:hypothetical protein
MKKIIWLFVMLFSFSIANAQTDKTVKKTDSKTEKKEKMATKSKDNSAKKQERQPVTIQPDNSDPAPGDTPASPGSSNAGTNTPLNAPSNMSNASPANNGTPDQVTPAPKQ